jgi:putative ABC transport system permease protein
MSLWTRIKNVLRGDQLSREIDEEFESHIAEAIAEGRDPAEARKAFGSPLRQREASRDVRIVAWLDWLRADVVFGWRQLRRNRVTSAVAVLSLALAMGSSVSAFRLIDALLLRPLPVVGADRLYSLSRGMVELDGKYQVYDGWEYPLFQQMRADLRGHADVLAVSYAERTDLTFGADEEMEKAHLQYVSGNLFVAFGLQPVLGRMLAESDDVTPGSHPYAVISYDYWTRRFGRDQQVIGRRFHLGKTIYEIVGVSPESFTGTEPGIVTDVFVPTMMNAFVGRSDADWIRTLVMLNPGTAVESVRDRIQSVSNVFTEQRLKAYPAMPKGEVENYLKQKVLIERARSGVSEMQKGYGRALGTLSVLVAMVLLIACANVASLATAQAAARAREMALRVSIGAGRLRLVRLVLIESAMIAFLAAVLGGVVAWRAAPFVVSMINPADEPVRLLLPADWRVAGFALALTAGVTLLFGLTPALRASTVRPVDALKGGGTASLRHGMMHWQVAVQVAFCFLVVLFAGLFVTTFKRLSEQPIGFSANGVLLLDTVTQRPQPPVYWDQAIEHLRSVPGVEQVALAGFPLMGGDASNGRVAIGGGPPNPGLVYFLNVSPGWVDAMKVQLLDGRDFRSSDIYPNTTTEGSAIVNESFAKLYFNGENPVGKRFERTADEGKRISFRIVGWSRDARYRNIREERLPVAYVPFHFAGPDGELNPVGSGTFVVRTSNSDPMQLAATLRREVPRAWSAFRVSNIRTQEEINRAQTIRERLLAMLGVFFAGVALLLAGIGLYGVLNYSVLQRRREIGIRVAIGARSAAITRLVAGRVFSMVAVGALAGAALGLASARYAESLFYQVKASDSAMLAMPFGVIALVALLGTVPAVWRALQIDPAEILRSE